MVKARKAVEEMEAKEKIEAATAAATPPVRLCDTGCGEIATVRCPRCNKECFNIAWPDHKGPCKVAAVTLNGKPVDEFDKDFEEYKRLAKAECGSTVQPWPLLF